MPKPSRRRLLPFGVALVACLLVVADAAADDISQLALPTGDLVYDRVTRRIYASVVGSGGVGVGNSIAAIDPLARVLRSAVFVGSDPGLLALTDDGEYVYVTLDGGRAIRRFHVPSQTAGMQFGLGSFLMDQPYYAADLAAVPGQPRSVAVARRFITSGSPPRRHAGVQIYDDGTPRAASTPAAGWVLGGSVLAFGASAARLYAYLNEPGDSGVFRRLAVGASEITVLETTFGLITGDAEIRFDDGLLYVSTGRVFEPETRTLVGTFPDVPLGSLVAPDAAAGRVFFLGGANTRYRILAYDRRTFRKVGEIVITGVRGAPSRLIRWGEDGLAFRTSQGQLFLVRTALVAPSAVLQRQRIAVFRPSTREWFLRGDDATATTVIFGGPGDQPVPADYLGTGRPQIAVFRPQTREWFIRTPVVGMAPVQFGGAGDVPVPADYLGLGRVQIAVFRSRTQEWFLRLEDGRATRVAFGSGSRGAAGGDVPVPRDYFGLGRAQIAVFRPDTAEWFLRTDAGEVVRIPWGTAGDQPVPADYQGSGRAQIAVYRPVTSEWFLRDDEGRATRISFGAPGDVPLPGDYDLTGRAQLAVYRPTTGEWFVRDDGGDVRRYAWGAPGDIPIPALYEHRFGLDVP